MQVSELDSLSQWFSYQDSICLLEIMKNLSAVKEEHEIVYIISHDIRKLIPFEKVICGVGGIRTKEFTYCINIDFPHKFLDDISEIVNHTKVITCPVIDKLLATDCGLIQINNTLSFNKKYEEWTESAHTHHVNDLIAVAKLHKSTHTMSYFNFSNLFVEYNQFHVYVLNLLKPFLDAAIHSIVRNNQRPVYNLLTKREIEILKFISFGLSNKDIARKLVLSEQTVKHHVSSILFKTQTKTRLQATIAATNY